MVITIDNLLPLDAELEEWFQQFLGRSLPKIQSGPNSHCKKNHRIIESDVCNSARAWNACSRPVQIAVPAMPRPSLTPYKSVFVSLDF